MDNTLLELDETMQERAMQVILDHKKRDAEEYNKVLSKLIEDNPVPYPNPTKNVDGTSLLEMEADLSSQAGSGTSAVSTIPTPESVGSVAISSNNYATTFESTGGSCPQFFICANGHHLKSKRE